MACFFKSLVSQCLLPVPESNQCLSNPLSFDCVQPSSPSSSLASLGSWALASLAGLGGSGGTTTSKPATHGAVTPTPTAHHSPPTVAGGSQGSGVMLDGEGQGAWKEPSSPRPTFSAGGVPPASDPHPHPYPYPHPSLQPQGTDEGQGVEVGAAGTSTSSDFAFGRPI